MSFNLISSIYYNNFKKRSHDCKFTSKYLYDNNNNKNNKWTLVLSFVYFNLCPLNYSKK